MEKRSRRRTRDLVTHSASQGLSENEIGCVRISIMAKSMNALFTGRIQKRKTNPLRHSHSTCNTRPVHTVGQERHFRPQPVGPAPPPIADLLPHCDNGRNVPETDTEVILLDWRELAAGGSHLAARAFPAQWRR